MKSLEGRTALLTGASRGIGQYIGRALAEHGVNVVLAARGTDALESAARELRSMGVRAVPIAADIAETAARKRLLEQAQAAMGPIDILINNAGMEWLSRYTNLSTDFIDTMIQTNLAGPLILSRLLLPQMIERGAGHIVMMSSLGGKKGSPYTATYAATKAGLIEWTAGIREELAGTGVSASVICPGFISGAGMFAAYGKRAPWIAGESRPEQVAAAVIRAIRDDVGEIIVNPGPVRLMMVTNAISPAALNWVFKAFGIYEFYRKQAEVNDALRASRHPATNDSGQFRDKHTAND